MRYLYERLLKKKYRQYHFHFKVGAICLVALIFTLPVQAFQVESIRTLNSFDLYNGEWFRYSTDIATDSQGLPVVVYINTATAPQNSLMLSRCLDKLCDNVITKTLASNLGNNPIPVQLSIAFNSNDRLGIIFSRQEQVEGIGQTNIYYIECTDPSCDSMTESLVEDRQSYQFFQAEIAFDADDKLNVLARLDLHPGYLILYRCTIDNGVFDNNIVNNPDECAFPWMETGTYPTAFELAFNSQNFPVISWQHNASNTVIAPEKAYVVQCLDSDCINEHQSSDLANSTNIVFYDFDLSPGDAMIATQPFSEGQPGTQAAFTHCIDAACGVPVNHNLVAPAETDSQTFSRVDHLPSGNFVVSYTVQRLDGPVEDLRNHSLYATTCYPNLSCDTPILIEADLGFLRHAGDFHTASSNSGAVYLTYFDTLTDGNNELKIARLGNTCTLTATDDSWVQSNRGNRNFGAAGSLDVRPQNNAGGNIRRSLVRFDSQNGSCAETGQPLPVGSTIHSANLEMAVNQMPSEPRQLAATRIQENWSESSVTWNNQPQTTTIATATSATAPVMSWNVTDDVIQFVDGSLDDYGWLLSDADEGSGINGGGAVTELSSKENLGGEQPSLVIEYSN